MTKVDMGLVIHTFVAGWYAINNSRMAMRMVV